MRLHGIDTPETGQPFGNAAKQRASELVFGQVVRVGLAWWYRQYAPRDTELELDVPVLWICCENGCSMQPDACARKVRETL